MSGIIDTVGSKSGIVGSDVYPAGHVIQTVHSSSSAYGSTNQPGYVAGHNLAITPTSSSSKIWVNITSNILLTRSDNNRPKGHAAIFRGSASTILRAAQLRATTATANQGLYWTVHFDYFDSPATTSATTYGIALKAEGTASYLYFDDGGPATITLMEISQ